MCIWLVMLVRTLQGRILLLMGVILLARGSVGWVMDTYMSWFQDVQENSGYGFGSYLLVVYLGN